MNTLPNEQDAVDLATTPPMSEADRPDLVKPAVRDRLLSLLASLGTEWNTMRFGQMICALTACADAAVQDSIYDIEDEELIASAEERLRYFLENPRNPPFTVVAPAKGCQ